MKITDDEFNALAVDLATVLKKYSVPQTEIDELMTIYATRPTLNLPPVAHAEAA